MALCRPLFCAWTSQLATSAWLAHLKDLAWATPVAMAADTAIAARAREGCFIRSRRKKSSTMPQGTQLPHGASPRVGNRQICEFSVKHGSHRISWAAQEYLSWKDHYLLPHSSIAITYIFLEKLLLQCHIENDDGYRFQIFLNTLRTPARESTICRTISYKLTTKSDHHQSRPDRKHGTSIRAHSTI